MLWIDAKGRVWESRRNANGTFEAKCLDYDSWCNEPYSDWTPVDLRFLTQNGFFRVS